MKSGYYHNAVIVDHGFSRTSNGTPQIFIRFAVEGEGEITAFKFLSEAAAKYTMETLRACGFQGDDIADIADGNCLCNNMADIEVTEETYEGKTRLKVGYINPVGQSRGVKNDPDVANQAKKWNALLRSTPKLETATYSPDTHNKKPSQQDKLPGMQDRKVPAGHDYPPNFDPADDEIFA